MANDPDDSQPGPVGTYDPTTALIVVDTQNDFADPQGNLYVPGGERVVPTINTEIGVAREAGALIVYTQDWHPETTRHFQKDGGIWPVHCVRSTWGAEFHPDLVVDGPVVRKGSEGGDGYSGFSVRDPNTGEETSTELDDILRDAGVERVIVVGLAQDYCVKETALDARERGYHTELLADATAPVNMAPGDGTRAIATLVHAGVSVR